MRNLTADQRRRASALGIGYYTLAARLCRGWSIERATGQLAKLRMPSGQRQTYRHHSGSRYWRLAHAATEGVNERRTVAAICAELDLPTPDYRKPMRASPWTPPALRKRPSRNRVDWDGIESIDTHRDA